jgi:hypothetical protein
MENVQNWRQHHGDLYFRTHDAVASFAFVFWIGELGISPAQVLLKFHFFLISYSRLVYAVLCVRTDFLVICTSPSSS